ncbi:MAG TPA: hypothetical protein VGP82_00255 [Ktedonobacterales bacterium]|nr:hypothetical protein [Ktedonobacterales bacterium]
MAAGSAGSLPVAETAHERLDGPVAAQHRVLCTTGALTSALTGALTSAYAGIASLMPANSAFSWY